MKRGFNFDDSVPAAELWAFVESALQGHCSARLIDLQRRPSEYRSSFPLEELEARFDDGSMLPLIFKDVSPAARSVGEAQVKPAFLYNPLREIEVYRFILEPPRLWAPQLYGGVADDSRGHYWLLLEELPGQELYQIGDFPLWQAVVRWLAELHRQLGPLAARHAEQARLLRYDADYFRQWPERAAKLVGPSLAGDEAYRFGRLLASYERVVERLVQLPVTFIHGELYASNVLVEPRSEKPRVSAVDWEMAGIGPGLIDLAALVAGRWTPQQQRELALTYRAVSDTAGSVTSLEQFSNGLHCCRLHLAMQWLGWSAQWSPPAAHAHDWLAEALEQAAELGL